MENLSERRKKADLTTLLKTLEEFWHQGMVTENENVLIKKCALKTGLNDIMVKNWIHFQNSAQKPVTHNRMNNDKSERLVFSICKQGLSRELLRKGVQELFNSKYEQSSGNKRMSYKKVAAGLISSRGLPEGCVLKQPSQYALSELLALLSCSKELKIFDTSNSHYANGESNDEIDEQSPSALEDVSVNEIPSDDDDDDDELHQQCLKERNPWDNPEVLRQKVQELLNAKYEQSSGNKRISYKKVAAGLISSKGLPKGCVLKKPGNYGLLDKMAILSSSKEIEIFDTPDKNNANGKSNDEIDEQYLEKPQNSWEPLRKEVQGLFNSKYEQSSGNKRISYKDVAAGLISSRGLPKGCVLKNPSCYGLFDSLAILSCSKKIEIFDTPNGHNANGESNAPSALETVSSNEIPIDGGDEGHKECLEESNPQYKKDVRKKVQELFNSKYEQSSGNKRISYKKVAAGLISSRGFPEGCVLKKPSCYGLFDKLAILSCSKEIEIFDTPDGYNANGQSNDKIDELYTPDENNANGKLNDEIDEQSLSAFEDISENDEDQQWECIDFYSIDSPESDDEIVNNDLSKPMNNLQSPKTNDHEEKIETERERSSFLCEHCGVKFAYRSRFRMHMMRHTDERPYECEHCGKTFIKRSKLKRHLRMIHMKEAMHECECCGPNLTQVCDFEEHFQPHTEALYVCEYCEYTFKERCRLRQHLMMHTGEKPYKCEHCGKEFKEIHGLTIHLKTHSGKTPYECQHCGKKFRVNQSFQKHLRMHAGQPLFICEHCGKKFKHRNSFMRHLMIHTGEKPFDCGHCGRRFKDRGTLKNHSRIHTGEKPFKCTHCAKKFRSSGTLKMHLAIHTEETPYECTHCYKKFKRKNDLRSHLRMHTGERPYKCEHCGKMFKHNCNMKRHMISHTGERPYGCEHCGWKFKDPTDLRRHLRIHTGETAYECEYCSKKFRYCRTFKSHVRMHTGERLYQCDYCDEKFKDSRCLKRHLRTRHAETQ
ncbi:zinc finger protein 665-like [Anneissia japonica]|uniref:zinc finger protein 665-like n=1 Tax=Anneissia japonica TaxID=1529436 RepID=UPI001425519E|nr:zinc finger protein 665-like [Anneissia japonica]